MNPSPCVAERLHPPYRLELAVLVLSKQEPISQIANREQVSRKFLYQQRDIAKNALNTAFNKQDKDNEVLYYLPVTQKWIFQLILALILICHCSYRGVVELLRDLFDYSVSIGTIHNRVKEATQKARKINQSQDLSPIKVALLDELFQGNRPVLTGVDAHSTYCFLLEEVEHRDEDTWGWYLLEASEQGLNPDYTIADAAKGLRAGQKAAWEEKPCSGDVWHIFDQGTTLCRNLSKKSPGSYDPTRKTGKENGGSKIKEQREQTIR